MSNAKHPFPWHGWLGIGLAAIFWILNWSLTGLRTHWFFLPLWAGFALLVDALTFLRDGSSLVRRSWPAFLSLFLISIPSWWLFELINSRSQNWFYDGAQFFTPLQYGFFTSLGFSTVMPAVFTSASLVATFDWLKKLRLGPKIDPTRPTLLGFFVAGWVMLALLWTWPHYFFPFAWLAVFFILEPVNYWLGYRSLARSTARGNWRPVIALFLGCLLCAFFWEMWNYYSYPKWIYRVPFVNFWHVFEMPLLGYGGYLPFSLELYALYNFVAGVSKSQRFREFVHILAD